MGVSKKSLKRMIFHLGEGLPKFQCTKSKSFDGLVKILINFIWNRRIEKPKPIQPTHPKDGFNQAVLKKSLKRMIKNKNCYT